MRYNQKTHRFEFLTSCSVSIVNAHCRMFPHRFPKFTYLEILFPYPHDHRRRSCTTTLRWHQVPKLRNLQIQTWQHRHKFTISAQTSPEVLPPLAHRQRLKIQMALPLPTSPTRQTCHYRCPLAWKINRYSLRTSRELPKQSLVPRAISPSCLSQPTRGIPSQIPSPSLLCPSSITALPADDFEIVAEETRFITASSPDPEDPPFRVPDTSQRLDREHLLSCVVLPLPEEFLAPDLVSPCLGPSEEVPDLDVLLVPDPRPLKSVDQDSLGYWQVLDLVLDASGSTLVAYPSTAFTDPEDIPDPDLPHTPDLPLMGPTRPEEPMTALLVLTTLRDAFPSISNNSCTMSPLLGSRFAEQTFQPLPVESGSNRKPSRRLAISPEEDVNKDRPAATSIPEDIPLPDISSTPDPSLPCASHPEEPTIISSPLTTLRNALPSLLDLVEEYSEMSQVPDLDPVPSPEHPSPNLQPLPDDLPASDILNLLYSSQSSLSCSRDLPVVSPVLVQLPKANLSRLRVSPLALELINSWISDQDNEYLTANSGTDRDVPLQSANDPGMLADGVRSFVTHSLHTGGKGALIRGIH